MLFRIVDAEGQISYKVILQNESMMHFCHGDYSVIFQTQIVLCCHDIIIFNLHFLGFLEGWVKSAFSSDSLSLKACSL